MSAARLPLPIAPRNVFEIWGTTVLLLWRHPLQFVGAALVLTGAGELIKWVWAAAAFTLGTEPDTTPAQAGQLVILLILLELAVYLSVFALTGAMQAVLVVHAHTGEPVTVRAALRLLARRIRPLIGVTSLLVAAPQLVVFGLAAALGTYFWHSLGPAIADGLASNSMPSIPGSFPVVLGFTLRFLHVLMLAWIAAVLALAFAPITAALEPVGFGGALRRSLLLMGGSLLRIVGILLLEMLAMLPIVVIFILPLDLAYEGLQMWLIDVVPASSEDVIMWMESVAHVVSVIADVVFEAWLVATFVLLYIDVRIRKEGLAADLWARRAVGRSIAG